jgi:Holliday junction resolvasome RuvABC DNA-binding subunit
MKKIVNGIEIELTAEEIAQREQDDIKAVQERIDFNDKIEQEKARKESAIAKLKALGLTEEEVKSIL